MQEEEEMVSEKKWKRSSVKQGRKETRAEIKRGKQVVGVEIEDEEDALATHSDSESLSEGEKQENIDLLKELRKESEEVDPTSSSKEEEDFFDVNDDLNAESDPNAPIPEPTIETNPPVQVPQPEIPSGNADEVAAVPNFDDAAAVDKVFSPTRKMRTKSVSKKRKMSQIADGEELDVERLTAIEDANLKLTVDVVMSDVTGAAATDAAAIEAEKVTAAKEYGMERRSRRDIMGATARSIEKEAEASEAAKKATQDAKMADYSRRSI